MVVGGARGIAGGWHEMGVASDRAARGGPIR